MVNDLPGHQKGRGKLFSLLSHNVLNNGIAGLMQGYWFSN